MEIFKFGILSVIQGITELLPISSSGHLLLTSELFGMELSTLILTILHLGTTLAIIVFAKDVLFKDLFSKEKLNFYLKILVASIPAGIAGVFLNDVIENKLRATWIIATSLILWGIIMIITERKINRNNTAVPDLEKISWKQSLIIGFSQTLALIPGTSRSGITTLTGIFLGLDKYTAFQYSFILGIPVLLGASVLEISKELLSIEDLSSKIFLAAGVKMLPVIFISFVTGYLALIVVRKFQKKNWLTVFGVYRIILGTVILILL